MHIVELKAENVKRLQAVHIKPDGSVVTIAGKNGAGKTSVLDAIAYALGGKSLHPTEPVRKGTKRAEVVIHVGDLVVKRTWSSKGTTNLTVESPDGSRHPSPQTILDELVGQLTFDPLQFVRMDRGAQVSTLKAVAGLDFTALDQEREAAFDERRIVNREVKTRAAQLEAMPEDSDVPDQEVDISDLAEQQAAAAEQLRQNSAIRQNVENLQSRIANGQAMIARLDDRVAELEAALAKAKAERVEAGELLDKLSEQLTQARAQADALEDPDMAAISARMRAAEDINRRVRAAQERVRQVEQLEQLRAKSEALTAQLAEIDRTKSEALAAADLPVEGLGFDDGGVTLGGLPFDQASSAEQLRVSVAMGAALNPKLKVMLCRDGSLLDADSLRLLASMAELHDLQIWLERVGTDDPCAVVIEDGMVKEQLARIATDVRRES